MTPLIDLLPSPSLDELLSAYNGAKQHLSDAEIKQLAAQKRFDQAKSELDTANTELASVKSSLKQVASLLSTALSAESGTL